MSVVASQRTESDLAVIIKARELAVYTIKIASNEKNFPKRYRWCITNKIIDSVIDINKYINKGNAIFVKGAEDFNIRRNMQVNAMAETYSLLAMMDIAYALFNVDSDRVDYWTGLVIELQRLIKKWRDSDYERYKNIG